jgi:PAS domain S-box-containing protein
MFLTGIGFCWDELFFAAFGQQLMLLPLLLAVGVAAWFWGTVCGVLVTLFMALADDCLVFQPIHTLHVDDLRKTMALVSFVIVGIAFSVVLGMLEAARRRLATKSVVLERKIEHLHKTEVRFQQLFQSTAGGFMIAHLDGRVLKANDTFLSMIGYTREDLADGLINWKKLTPPELLPLHEQSRRMHEQTGTANAYEKEYIRKDGSRVPVLIGGTIIEGSRDETVCFIIDLTELKQALGERDNALRKLHGLIESVPLGVSLFDSAGHYQLVNQHFAKTLGRSPGDILGCSLGEFHSDVGKKAAAAHRKVLQTRQPLLEHIIEGESPTTPGQRRIWQGNWFPVLGTDGEMESVGLVVQDITEQRCVEEEIATGSRRKDEFLATLAHELRNPLAPMSSAVQLIRESGGTGPELNRAVEILERQLRQMVHLVDDLLDVARISTGKITLRVEHIDLSSVVRNALELSQPLIDASRHALEVQLPPEPIGLTADPIRLAQILSNLLNNAAKYTPPGGIIRLKAVREGDTVLISVQDNGAGIPPEILPAIFDLFHQAGTTLRSAQGGIGVGLTLVRRLAELHGGTVDAISSGIGQGSEFRVRLPIHSAESPRMSRDENFTKRCNATPRDAGGRRILIVDDNMDAAMSLELLLKLQGHETLVTDDGMAALEQSGSFLPEIAILDIGLPGLNGYELATHLRRKPWGGSCVLVALTGWGQEEDKRRAREAGFDHHFVKPIDPMVLEELIGSLKTPR